MSKQREALKLALEVLEEINKLSIGENAICLPAEIDTAMDAIREALAEPEQKPVAWMLMNDTQCHIMATDWKPEDSDGWKTAPLYTAPPARKPLTEPELNAIEPTWPNEWNYDDVLVFVRAIERAHGIGND